jgi:hypothetical protein
LEIGTTKTLGSVSNGSLITAALAMSEGEETKLKSTEKQEWYQTQQSHQLC